MNEKDSTKGRILAMSLKLFNEYGTDAITVRHIAKEIGISHGNLCYHFSNKDDIIYTLYQNLVKEFDARFVELDSREFTLAIIMESSRFAINLFYNYKFFMLDFVSIMRNSERIRTHYVELMAQRKIQFYAVFDKLIKARIMRKEAYSGEFDNLIAVWTIIGDFWIAHSEVHYTGKSDEKIEYYSNLLFSVFIPFLTEKGLKEITSSIL